MNISHFRTEQTIYRLHELSKTDFESDSLIKVFSFIIALTKLCQFYVHYVHITQIK